MAIQRRGEDHRDWKLYGGSGSIGVEWYFRSTTQLSANVMLYHLEPGAEEGVHFHSEGPGACSTTSDEIYVVIDGEIVLVMDDERHVLREGDGAYAPQGVPHGVVNESDRPAELVLIFGPPKTVDA